jgi:hypothetical protein
MIPNTKAMIASQQMPPAIAHLRELVNPKITVAALSALA